MHKFGLKKRMASAVGGVEGLRKRLVQCHHSFSKPDSLIDGVVKEHILRLPLNLRNKYSLRDVYLNSIVQHPILYRMILRRRTIMPQELQHFLSRIMEATDLSDKVLISAAQPCAQTSLDEQPSVPINSETTKKNQSDLSISKRTSCMFYNSNEAQIPATSTKQSKVFVTSNTHVRRFSAAARELDASGFLPGGPRTPLQQKINDQFTIATNHRLSKNTCIGGKDSISLNWVTANGHRPSLLNWGLEGCVYEEDVNSLVKVIRKTGKKDFSDSTCSLSIDSMNDIDGSCVITMENVEMKPVFKKNEMKLQTAESTDWTQKQCADDRNLLSNQTNQHDLKYEKPIQNKIDNDSPNDSILNLSLDKNQPMEILFNHSESNNSQAFAYLHLLEFDKSLNILLSTPCANILEEVAYQVNEFALYIRPLFEYIWATLEDHINQIFPEMLNQDVINAECYANYMRQEELQQKREELARYSKRSSKIVSQDKSTNKEIDEEKPKTRRTSNRPSYNNPISEGNVNIGLQDKQVLVDLLGIPCNNDETSQNDISVQIKRAQSINSYNQRKVNTRSGQREHSINQYTFYRPFWDSMLIRVLNELHSDSIFLPGRKVWSRLLLLLHLTHYLPSLADAVVHSMDTWLPPLLVCLQSCYASVQQEACCILAYIVCSYRLLLRLHKASRNLLVANITLEALDAIGRNPDSYAVFHGLIGYLLHSVPSLSILDSLIVCVPLVADDPNSRLACDWGLFVYYAVKHWSPSTFRIDSFYARRLITMLEYSAMLPHSRKNARLALGYLTRRMCIRSNLITTWFPKNNDQESNWKD